MILMIVNEYELLGYVAEWVGGPHFQYHYGHGNCVHSESFVDPIHRRGINVG